MRRALLAVVTLGLATSAWAGLVQDELDDLEHGRVHFSFDAREGVWGNGHSMTVNGRWDRHDWGSHDWGGHGWDPDGDEMTPGPIYVMVYKRDDRIRRIKVHVGGPGPRVADGDVLLGRIDVHEAADFLLPIARTGRSGAAEDAIYALSLADGLEIWPDLLEIARDRDRPHDVRKNAIFWVGQAAADEVTGELAELIEDGDADVELKEQAVFALSQRDDREAVRTLSRLARTHDVPQVRRSAIFWLAQHDDPEVLDLFEEILLGEN